MQSNEIVKAESIGELKARCREHHICTRCSHVHVCRVAATLEPSMLIVISHCLAFDETVATENERRMCEA